MSPTKYPKLLLRVKCKCKGENNIKKESGDTLFSLQHFGGKGVCWSSGMGTRASDKQVNYLHGLAKPNNKLVNA
jgi:hypothetical protein